MSGPRPTGPREGLPVTRHGPDAAAGPDPERPASDPGGGGGGPREQPVFYYDLGSAESYLAAERVMTDLGEVPEWQPVLAAQLAAGGGEVAGDAGQHPAARARAAAAGGLDRAAVQARAAARGMQPLRWPEPYPFDAREAMLAATYAKQIGRAVAFSLAAFRQAFAAGRGLDDPDTVLIAGAACEMHPRALLGALRTRSVAQALERATAAAAAAGVRGVPAIRAGARVFHGDGAIERAAPLLKADD